ncbi:transposase [Paraburkholderia sediminicola]|uniref:transposase n=1 Tax=Paraburkholderia sediminicola TaxID=458836 RepID=UPI0038BB57BF
MYPWQGCPRIAHVRADFMHKLTTRLCRENQAVVIEDLNVKGMPVNERLAPTISDVGFGIFRPLMRRYVALRYFNIGAASIYAVKFLTEQLLGGKPR